MLWKVILLLFVSYYRKNIQKSLMLAWFRLADLSPFLSLAPLKYQALFAAISRLL